jgi:hypothetical protein
MPEPKHDLALTTTNKKTLDEQRAMQTDDSMRVVK